MLLHTTSETLPLLPYNYEKVIDKEFGHVFVLPEQNTMVCELTKEYVPIEQFKEIFEATVPFIKQYAIKKFVFDKQYLRVFHQPSMEWYFVFWKKEIFELGLRVHRKILPQNQPMFSLAVEAGRAKIMEDYKDTVISLLDIQYKTTLKEAIES
jgi:DNA polymerase elongation subunit (family B)